MSAPTVIAVDQRAAKYLSTNRDFYVLQSAMTRNGRVPTPDEVRAEIERLASHKH